MSACRRINWRESKGKFAPGGRILFSGYITKVLEEQEKRESLRTVLRDLIAQYGEPTAEDIEWAERALAPRRG